MIRILIKTCLFNKSPEQIVIKTKIKSIFLEAMVLENVRK